MARNQLKWAKDFEQVLECDMEKAQFKWFLGGKLNAAGEMLQFYLFTLVTM